MNCENYLKLIDDLVEGELDEQTADKVSLHIFDCPNCSAQFEILEREKEVYSHYLFEIEPPPYLQSKFELRLQAEEKEIIQQSIFSGIFAFLRLNPLLPIASVIILFATVFGLFNLKKENQPVETASGKQPSVSEFQPIPPTSEDKEITALENRKEKETPLVKTKFETAPTKVKVEPIKYLVSDKLNEIKQTEVVKKVQSKPKKLPPITEAESEEIAQLKHLQTLETETAKQLEKVELLLRSFRNAQMIEGSEMYDVSYETQQARRLLPTNIALRQQAEIYGTIFSEEMLSRVEPVLLDIANLKIDSSPEDVLEIKERVRNQNIIASLQGF